MRYTPHCPNDIKFMVEAIGVSSVNDLFKSIPEDHRFEQKNVKKGLTEWEIKKYFEKLSTKNTVFDTCLLGAGVYFHSVPSAVDHIISRSEFLTAYTPYQPEVSQGTLQAVFEFQTIVCNILGLDVSNASLYDGASGLGEALLMAVRIGKNKKKKVLISSAIHPYYLQVVSTMLDSFGGIEVEMLKYDQDSGKTQLPDKIDSNVAAIALGYPNFFGVVEDIEKAVTLVEETKSLVVSVTQDPQIFGLIKNPGELGVHIAVADGGSLAGSVGMGGPSVGLMACKQKLVKQMPGRIVGQTIDMDGDRGYVLTLATREQHIRREKATSNICSNQALVALAFTVHASLLGGDGFRIMAGLSVSRAEKLKEKLLKIDGVKPLFSNSFLNEFGLSFPCNTRKLQNYLKENSILFGLNLEKFYPEDEKFKNSLLLCTTEIISEKEIEKVSGLVSEFIKGGK
jgi:glycine cleavage system P protein (glycine dehydrogenase) subunit 1